VSSSCAGSFLPVASPLGYTVRAPSSSVKPLLGSCGVVASEPAWTGKGAITTIYQNAVDASVGSGIYFCFYNTEHPHQALGYKAPAEVFISTPVEDANRRYGRIL